MASAALATASAANPTPAIPAPRAFRPARATRAVAASAVAPRSSPARTPRVVASGINGSSATRLSPASSARGAPSLPLRLRLRRAPEDPRGAEHGRRGRARTRAVVVARRRRGPEPSRRRRRHSCVVVIFVVVAPGLPGSVNVNVGVVGVVVIPIHVQSGFFFFFFFLLLLLGIEAPPRAARGRAREEATRHAAVHRAKPRADASGAIQPPPRESKSKRRRTTRRRFADAIESREYSLDEPSPRSSSEVVVRTLETGVPRRGSSVGSIARERRSRGPAARGPRVVGV